MDASQSLHVDRILPDPGLMTRHISAISRPVIPKYNFVLFCKLR